MNEQEFRTEMTTLGMPEESLDIVCDIINNAKSPKEAMDLIHIGFPELEIEELKKDFDLVCQQAGYDPESFSEDTFELTEEELDDVAGGWSGWGRFFAAGFHIFIKTTIGFIGGLTALIWTGPELALAGGCIGAVLGLAGGIQDVVEGNY